MDREDEITIEVRLLRDRNYQLSQKLEEARVEIRRLEAIVDGLKAEITRERGNGVGSKDA